MARLLQIDVRFSRSFAGIYQSVFLPRNTPIFTLGMDKIADGLMADGILTGAGKTKWHTSTINKILRNEKYIGDALLQKTYTTDFLTKKRIKNNGTVPQYYVEGDHEAIILKDIFLLVQEELVRRRVVHTSDNGKRTVNETLLEQVVIDAINRVLCQKDDYDAIADEILRLRDQRRQAEVDSVIKDEQMKQIRDLQNFVKSQPATITEFDETLVSRLIEKITVFDDHFTVDFKSGITIDIEA